MSIHGDSSIKFNALNRHFYEVISSSFHDSRQYFWQGWESLWQTLVKQQNINSKFSILDLGCGNARFYEFLDSKINSFQDSTKLAYTGLDYTQDLLDQGLKKYPDNVNLINQDILTDDWTSVIDSQKYDLVVAFGVVHHLKKGVLCDNFFENIKKTLKPHSLLVFASWNFVDNPALMSRKANLEDSNIVEYLKKFDLQSSDFEKNDYLLDWKRGQNSWRFCHYYQELEVVQLLSQFNLELVEKFQADGKNNLMNTYWVCRYNP